MKPFGFTAREPWQPKTKPWSSRVPAVRSVTWSSRWVMAKAVPGRWPTVRAASGPGAKHVCACASGSESEQLAQTSLGGRVICEERDLLYEEAPAAYKNIEACDSRNSWMPDLLRSSRPSVRSSPTRREPKDVTRGNGVAE